MSIQEKHVDALIKELVDIKRLLMVDLISRGVSDEVIGKVLDISSSAIRHIVPLKAARKLGKNEN